MKNQLTLDNYTVYIEGKQIINNVCLSLKPGASDILMGPNGSGKSSLALSLLGHPAYTVTGTAHVHTENLLTLPPHKRAHAGLFVSFQQPHEFSGLPVATYLQAILQTAHGHIEPALLEKKVYHYLDLLDLDHSFYYRNVNQGFSGGQKKKFEMLQLLLLKPRVAILDEIDSGLDVDALKRVAQALQIARQENPDMAMLIITHYQHLIDYTQVDAVHLLMHGSIITTGDYHLAKQIEQHGYDAVRL